MDEEPSTERRLREAAVRALVEHGYARLSIADIGEEFGRSTSLIYHYHSSKDDLLLSTLDDVTELFVERQVEEPITDPERELRDLIDAIVHPSSAHAEGALSPFPSDADAAWARVYVELWAQATWDEEYRKRISRVDDRLEGTISRIIAAGIEDGQFSPVDPDTTAIHVMSLLRHALHTRATTNREKVSRAISVVIEEIIADLRVEA